MNKNDKLKIKKILSEIEQLNKELTYIIETEEMKLDNLYCYFDNMSQIQNMEEDLDSLNSAADSLDNAISFLTSIE